MARVLGKVAVILIDTGDVESSGKVLAVRDHEHTIPGDRFNFQVVIEMIRECMQIGIIHGRVYLGQSRQLVIGVASESGCQDLSNAENQPKDPRGHHLLCQCTELPRP